MIVGCGIDLVEVSRFLVGKASESFLHKVFTPQELADCQAYSTAAEKLAGRFAAKEACMKALGNGLKQGVHFGEIEVVTAESGQPSLKLHGKALAIAKSFGMYHMLVSTSHTRNHAVAIVILEVIPQVDK